MFTLSEIQILIQAEIDREAGVLRESPPLNLYAPVHYILGLGGKKLRPSLVLLSYNLFSETVFKALPAAMAIEIFHNFTLLHDDIMDQADLRRNNQTVHVKYSENAAILSGDVMAFISFRYLLKSETSMFRPLLDLFTKTAIEVCEGQQLDMDFENRWNVTEMEYLEMIRLKTAVLLACSLKSGALLAAADESATEALYLLGINLGLAFQLQDDYLDTFGDEKTFGKKIGGDILSNKKTFLLIKAFEMAGPEQKELLFHWFEKSGYIPEEKILAVKSVYDELGIAEITREKSNEYFLNVEKCLNDIPVSEQKKVYLREFVKSMTKRNY